MDGTNTDGSAQRIMSRSEGRLKELLAAQPHAGTTKDQRQRVLAALATLASYFLWLNLSLVAFLDIEFSWGRGFFCAGHAGVPLIAQLFTVEPSINNA